jgi:hypothetical protein
MINNIIIAFVAKFLIDEIHDRKVFFFQYTEMYLETTDPRSCLVVVEFLFCCILLVLKEWVSRLRDTSIYSLPARIFTTDAVPPKSYTAPTKEPPRKQLAGARNCSAECLNSRGR